MKLKFLFALLILSVTSNVTYGQVMITEAQPTATINFSNSMQTTVGTTPSTRFEGDGFAPNPTTAGRLNSNAWEVKGWSFGDLLFGGTQTVDDFARGAVTGGVITPGMYAYTESPGTVANPAMMIQPGAGDFQPGTVALKIKNNGTTNMTQISVNYNVFVRNDENTSSAFNFSHSPDNNVYVAEPLLDYTSPDVADAFQWINIDLAPSRTCVISGINIAPGAFYYIRWSSFLVSGTGASDEFGLDDIVITGTYGLPAPEINVVAYGNTLLSGDVTPTVGEGTEFAPSYAPISTVLTTLQITYTIQNLGGSPLNISSVTITGANASDFSFTGNPLGSIPAASATISTKSFTVIFDPSLPGLRKARINIVSDDTTGNENPYFFDIQGYGIIPIPDIRINGGGNPGGGTSIVTSGSMVPALGNNTLFGADQVVGSAGLTHPFVIRNDCPYNAAVILTDPSPYISFSGNHPSDFSVVAIPATNSINPGFTKTFSIKFAPTAPGIRNAIVTIPNNDPDEGPFVFLVQGKGVAPEMDVTGNSQPVISGSTTTSFVNYTFFDYLNINTGTLDRTFVIKNTGDVALTIGATTIVGPNAADFSIITAPPASVAIGGTATFTIRFDPSAVGLRTATVSIINNDPNENPYTFAISGFGLDYIPCSFGPIETIATQDFETSPATPTWGFGATGGPYSLAGGTAYGISGDSGATNKFIGARSLQVSGGTAVVSMANVNTTLYSDIELNLRIASYATTAIEGADATDRVLIAISSNGLSGPWSNEIDVLGNTNAKWSFTSGTGIATTPFDNNNVAASFAPGPAGFATIDGYGTVSISGLPKVSNLAVRITIANNSTAEIWALDNVTLFGRKELSTTWTNTWSNGAPTATVKAIIDGDYNGGSISSCKCQIKPGRNVIIGANVTLDIQSELENGGSLTIEDKGSLVQHNDLAVNLGVVKVKRYTTPMRAFDYTYWSSPVIGQSLFAISPNTLSDKFFSFSPTIGNWVVIPNGAETMVPTKGYIVRAPQSFTSVPTSYLGAEFNGVPNNGFLQAPITIGNSNMNLIGNPYPSAIDIEKFLSYSSNVGVVEGTIYLWTHNTPITAFNYQANDYAVYNTTGPVATRAALTTGVNTSAPTKFLASCQSFFIKGLSAGQATFNNSMRVSGNNASFFRPGSNSESDTDAAVDGIEKSRIWLNLSNSAGAFKQTLVGYIEGATNGIDRSFDGELYNANSFISFYSIVAGKTMAIQGRALPFQESDKVILGYTSTLNGIFDISIENVDGIMTDHNIYLEDKLLNVIHDLKQAPYSFETAIGTFDDRFELRYDTNALGTDAFSAAGNALLVAVNHKDINILSQNEIMKSVTVYDLLGRNIFQDLQVNNSKFTINNVVSNQQALIVKIVLDNGKIVTRKVVL